MRELQDWVNRLAVQLYKHVPWLGTRWARKYRFVAVDTSCLHVIHNTRLVRVP